ncbi:MAG: GntR family transcriptional regulator [Chloroflexi bacterium]|nr:MAG: GntR family transcriptional regulator [Chloroflexota bacterium]
MTSSHDTPSGDTTPVYQRIANDLRALIKSGQYAPGVALPSERKLMERYNVARMTVREALAELRTEGLIRSEPGAGVFVRERPMLLRISGPERFSRADRERGQAAFAADMARLNRRWTPDVIDVSRVPADDEIASYLRVEPGTMVVRRYRVFSVEGHRQQIATSYIPLDLAEGTPIEQENPGPGGTYARLEERGHTIDSYREDITARMPTRAERDTLQLDGDGIPVFRVVRFAIGTTGRVLEITDTLLPADRHLLSYPWQAT